jgi:hypothetical protein
MLKVSIVKPEHMFFYYSGKKDGKYWYNSLKYMTEVELKECYDIATALINNNWYIYYDSRFKCKSASRRMRVGMICIGKILPVFKKVLNKKTP